MEHLELVSKEMIIKDVIALEQNMFKWLQTDLIYKALQWRDFIEMELKKNFLQSIIREKRDNFDPHCSTAENNVESEIVLHDPRNPAVTEYRW